MCGQNTKARSMEGKGYGMAAEGGNMEANTPDDATGTDAIDTNNGGDLRRRAAIAGAPLLTFIANVLEATQKELGDTENREMILGEHMLVVFAADLLKFVEGNTFAAYVGLMGRADGSNSDTDFISNIRGIAEKYARGEAMGALDI